MLTYSSSLPQLLSLARVIFPIAVYQSRTTRLKDVVSVNLGVFRGFSFRMVLLAWGLAVWFCGSQRDVIALVTTIATGTFMTAPGAFTVLFRIRGLRFSLLFGFQDLGRRVLPGFVALDSNSTKDALRPQFCRVVHLQGLSQNPFPWLFLSQSVLVRVPVTNFNQQALEVLENLLSQSLMQGQASQLRPRRQAKDEGTFGRVKSASQFLLVGGYQQFAPVYFIVARSQDFC